MKILLINPRSTEGKAKFLPLGLAYLAAVLVEEGFNVKVIDSYALNLVDKETVKIADEFKPQIVGITSMTPQINNAWRIAELCKESLPQTKIVLGGVHPTILPLESIAKTFVDIVIVGEGEYTIKELSNAIMNKKSLKNIKGIIYKENGNVITNSPRELITDLDKLPYPARDLFPFPDAYSPGYYRKLPYATIVTSRGCPGKCTFCNKSTFGNRFRARSASDVVNEITYLNKKYGVKEFHISDDNFTTNKKRAIEICDLIIERELNIYWACSNGIRIDFVNQILLNKMKEAGCYRVAFGIESGSRKILKNINKEISLEKIKSTVDIAKKAKLITVGFFMVGNYGETEETIEETIRFIKELDLDYVQSTIATPYPGTELEKQVLLNGKIFAKDWSEFEIYSGAIFEWNNLSKEEIDHFQKRVYRKSYFSLRNIFKRVFNIRHVNDLLFLINGFKILINVIRLRSNER